MSFILVQPLWQEPCQALKAEMTQNWKRYLKGHQQSKNENSKTQLAMEAGTRGHIVASFIHS